MFLNPLERPKGSKEYVMSNVHVIYASLTGFMAAATCLKMLMHV